MNNSLELKCTQDEFKNIDVFLMEQEFAEKPPFDYITLEVRNVGPYYYELAQMGSKWYIITR